MVFGPVLTFATIRAKEALLARYASLGARGGAPSSHGGSASSNSALGSAFRTKGVHNGSDGDELSLADRAHLRVASYRLGERVA